jgi:hypothetical protein
MQFQVCTSTLWLNRCRNMTIVVGPPYTTVQEAFNDLTRLEAEFLACMIVGACL